MTAPLEAVITCVKADKSAPSGLIFDIRKELQEIKELVLEELEEEDDDSVDGYIRNTQNYETAKEAFFNAVNRGIDLNSLTNILDNLA